MSRRGLIFLALLVVVAVAVVVVSSLVAGQLDAATGQPGRPLGQLGLLLGGFGPGPFGRFGPFGRHLAGWRGLASALGAFCFLYLAGLLTLLVAPRRLSVVRDAFGPSARGWLRLFGVGALALVLLVLLVALGLFTFALFPLTIALLTALLLAAWAGVVGLALALGRGLRRAAGAQRAGAAPMLDFALGLLLVFALGRIPFAGWGIVLLIGAVALGAVVTTRLGTGGDWSLAELNGGE